jgi:sulfate adenylyltransferase
MAILPHGGKLLPLLKEGEDLKRGLERARDLPQVRMTSREVSDLIMLGMGAFSPLKGFMGREDYEGVLREMHLKDGTFWPVPITLAVEEKEGDRLKIGYEVCLIDKYTGQIMGIMEIEEKFRYEKDAEAKAVFQTDDNRHPGVKKLYEQGEILLGGPVKVLSGDFRGAGLGNYCGLSGEEPHTPVS